MIRILPVSSTLLALFAIFLSADIYADGGIWSALSEKQRSELRAGKQIRIDGTNPKVWSVTYYQQILPYKAAVNADPENSAAIFWDLKGQVDYLAKFGFTDVAVSSGQGTAAVRCVVKSLVPTPGGHRTLEYPQANAIYRAGSRKLPYYVSSWHSTDPSRGEHPGFLAVWGDVTFDRIPGKETGSLLAYRAVTVPAAEILENVALRENLYDFYAKLVRAHSERMARGASSEQLSSLRTALGSKP